MAATKAVKEAISLMGLVGELCPVLPVFVNLSLFEASWRIRVPTPKGWFPSPKGFRALGSYGLVFLVPVFLVPVFLVPVCLVPVVGLSVAGVSVMAFGRVSVSLIVPFLEFEERILSRALMRMAGTCSFLKEEPVPFFFLSCCPHSYDCSYPSLK